MASYYIFILSNGAISWEVQNKLWLLLQLWKLSLYLALRQLHIVYGRRVSYLSLMDSSFRPLRLYCNNLAVVFIAIKPKVDIERIISTLSIWP